MRGTIGIASGMAGLMLLVAGTLADAGTIRVRVVDLEGAPVPEVVVMARQPGADHKLATGMPAATMNQHGLAFEPHILVVQAGARVDFPNADDVLHHVYSFSEAKHFDMTIDAGTVHGGMQFDEPGIVTLGCNIHDGMLGYIVVADTPFFAKTGFDGMAELTDLPAGGYEISIWTPRIAPRNLPPPLVHELDGDQTFEYEQRFERKLYPPHAHSATSLNWSDY